MALKMLRNLHDKKDLVDVAKLSAKFRGSLAESSAKPQFKLGTPA